MEEQREKTKKHGAGFAVRIIILTAAAAVFCYAAFQLYSIYHAIDATGAGDAFWGGFISTLLNEGVTSTADLTADKIREALTYGNVSGWCCVQTKGGMTSLPTRAQIEKVLEDERK